jgi:phosphoadenosine phosphosulfate reductase
MTLNLEKLNETFDNTSATEILKWTFDHFEAGRIAMSTSFGAEGMVLIHMLVSMGLKPRIFTIDTGRNFQETYDVWEETIKRYGVEIEAYYPDPEALRELVKTEGPNLFYNSVENRQNCCNVRKVQPLTRALADADVWLAALRRGQGESRRELDIVARSEQHDVIKICPLANWFEENVWTYVRSNGVAYNKLYDQGFLTIGCAPCTRPVRPAEGIRSGRWWWEEDAKKECGIHIEDGKVVRKKAPTNYQI